MRRILGCWTASALTLAAAVASAATIPVAVSPGDDSELTTVGETCPTFSWGAVAGATGYELVVYKVTDAGDDAEPVLRQEIEGPALSWTPPLDRCLDRDSRFAWSVRAVSLRAVTGWSEERFFRIAAGDRLSEAASALAVLGRYLQEGGSLEELAASSQWAEAISELRPAARPSDPGGIELPAGEAVGAAGRREPEGSQASRVARAIDPIQHLGLGVELEQTNHSGSVAVQGLFDSVYSADQVAGFLGVTMPNTDFDDFVSPYLKWLSEDEIGVLGFSLNSSPDNWGVVGVGGGEAWGGRFLHSDSVGDVDHQVMLAGPVWGMEVRGDVRIRDGALVCPFGTHAVGSWCIGPEQSVNAWSDALRNCWEQGMRLCPLDAIMACDHLEPGGADCTAATDSSDPDEMFWLGDMPHPYEQVNELADIDEVYADPTNAWTWSSAWIYWPGGPVSNALEEDSKSTSHPSFCCTTPR